jgi:hypothetical protein
MDVYRTRKKTRPDIRFVSLDPQQHASDSPPFDSASHHEVSQKIDSQLDSNFEETFKKIKKRLDRIPTSYRNAKSFNVWEQVIKILRSDNFEESKQKLESDCESMNHSMELIVEQLYERFNKAIQNYTKILQKMTKTQQEVEYLNDDIEKANSAFSSRSQLISAKSIQRLECEFALLIIDKIKALAEVPERLQYYIQSKEYLNASILLVESEALLYQDSLRNIGALSALRDSLLMQRSLFHETIIDELKKLIFDEGVRSPAQREVFRPRHDHYLERPQSPSDPHLTYSTHSHFSSQMSSQEFVHLATEFVDCLFVLNRVKVAVDTLIERNPIEWRNIVKKMLTTAQNELTERDHSLSHRPQHFRQHHHSVHLSSERKFVPLLRRILEVTKHILSKHKTVCEIFRRKLDEETKETSPKSLFHFHSQRKRMGTLQIEEPTSVAVSSPLAPEIIEKLKRTYNVDTLWSPISQELQLLIGRYIGLGSSFDSNFNKKATDEYRQLSQQKLFRFSASSAFTFGEVSLEMGTVFSYVGDDFFLGDTPSPYNLAPIYPLIVAFNNDIKMLLTSKYTFCLVP